MAKDKDRDREDPHRQIVPELRGEAQEIFAWLCDLFHLSQKDTKPGAPKAEPDTMPESVRLCPVFGVGGAEKGPELHSKSWKPMSSPIPPQETLVALANEFYGKAKKHVAVNQQRQRFCLFAYNNLKGPDAYSVHPFAIFPGAREYREGEAPASDDFDSHRDRLLAQALAHNRWFAEQFMEAQGNLVKMQNQIIQQQRDEIAQMSADRRALILTAEEALSRKQEREERAASHAMKMELIQEGIMLAKGQLVPALSIYLSKGKVGVPQAVQGFIGQLTEEQRQTLFGTMNEQGERLSFGILDQEQLDFLGDIINGKIEARRLSEFVVMLRPDQIEQVQNVLGKQKMEQLISLAKTAASPPA